MGWLPKPLLHDRSVSEETLTPEAQLQSSRPAAISHSTEPLTSGGGHQYQLAEILTCGFTEKLFELYVEIVKQKKVQEGDRKVTWGQ